MPIRPTPQTWGGCPTGARHGAVRSCMGVGGIRNVPTLLVVKDGQVAAARSGALSGAALAAFVSNAVA